jgi:diguanylate cyclase (GGDEF)-like protein
MRFLPAPFWGLSLLALVGAPAPVAGQTCAGSPFVNVIRPRAIEESAGVTVGPQIFDVAPHPRGFVLMANNNGLLTYDGVGFRLLSLGRSEVALSVGVGADGRMFAGGARTFGEVVEDPTGLLLYQPLEARLKPSDRDFSDVWQTLVSSDGVAYFRSRERLAFLDKGEVQAVSPVGRFSAAGLVDDVLYAHDTGVGLVVVKGGSAALAQGGGALREVRVTAITGGGPGFLLIGTQDRGLLRFDLAKGRFARLGEFGDGIAASEILSVSRLANEDIAVGTLRNGLHVLDRDGRPLLRMDRDHGLPDNAVLALKTVTGSLWAGTSGGVAQLLLPGSVEAFSAGEGLPGIVEAMVRHNGVIYAATSQGVFRMTCAGAPFEALPSLRKQSFALLSAGSLFAATADGIYEINGTNARLVRPGRARGLAASKNGERVWAATQNGPAALVRTSGQWQPEPPLIISAAAEDEESLDGVEATSIGEDESGRLWVSLAAGRVVAGWPTAQEKETVLSRAQTFGANDGISGGFVEVIALKEGIRIGTATSVLRFERDRLVPDFRFTSALGEGKGAFRIKDAEGGGYWVASAKRPLRLVEEAKGGLTLRNTPLLRTPAGSRILAFLEVSPREMWIGADDGAFRYNPEAGVQGQGSIAARIRRVRSNQQELFAGGPTDALEAELPHLAPLRFEVSSSSFDDPSRNRFRFRLDGQDIDWSPWTLETRKDYTNLGPGVYRFRVETRDVYGRVGDEAGISFVVSTPWYLTFWARALALVAVAFLFFLLLDFRTRTLKKRQRELESIVEQKTTELREASFTDPLTGLRNRRYFAEVIESEASLACRPDSPALHMFLVDLDHFKQVNDTWGHGAGDAILRQTAARLKVAMRTSDLIFRWGGEEFLIVARGAADLPRNEIANRIVRMLGQEPFDIGTGTKVARTCSVGFATYPFYQEDPGAVPLSGVIELADLSLYRAKRTGRNRAVGVSPRTGVPVAGDVWKSQVLENLEQAIVSVEVLEGPNPTVS